MASLSLKTLVGPRSASFATMQALRETLGGGLCIVDLSDKLLMGEASVEAPGVRVPVQLAETTLGFVLGPSAPAVALASMLGHLAVRESESRSLAAEVLQLYREINVIEQLSEQLAPLIDVAAISHTALVQAQRLVPATHGGIFVMARADDPLEMAASFGGLVGDTSADTGPLRPGSRFAASVLERDIAEIVNDCARDPRAVGQELGLQCLMCAPLRAGQRSVGVIVLASALPGASYSAANLKLINTIALQTAAAIENALLCAKMVETARDHAEIAAELQAASSVQQLLLQGASRATPGFKVDSVYLPASEVGGDFFLVSPAPDGSLTAIVGDVSGKGLTAAMRVAMVLGVLRRESSSDPGTILSALNDALINPDQLGFTTACCVRISLSGEYTLANAGHIAPFLSGREIETPNALPLGLVPDQTYELVSGTMNADDTLVLMSDGVPEARSPDGQLYGFDRLSALTLGSATEIAETARSFGQEDDITVLTLGLD